MLALLLHWIACLWYIFVIEGDKRDIFNKKAKISFSFDGINTKSGDLKRNLDSRLHRMSDVLGFMEAKKQF